MKKKLVSMQVICIRNMHLLDLSCVYVIFSAKWTKQLLNQILLKRSHKYSTWKYKAYHWVVWKMIYVKINYKTTVF